MRVSSLFTVHSPSLPLRTAAFASPVFAFVAISSGVRWYCVAGLLEVSRESGGKKQGEMSSSVETHLGVERVRFDASHHVLVFQGVSPRARVRLVVDNCSAVVSLNSNEYSFTVGVELLLTTCDKTSEDGTASCRPEKPSRKVRYVNVFITESVSKRNGTD